MSIIEKLTHLRVIQETRETEKEVELKRQREREIQQDKIRLTEEEKIKEDNRIKAVTLASPYFTEINQSLLKGKGKISSFGTLETGGCSLIWDEVYKTNFWTKKHELASRSIVTIELFPSRNTINTRYLNPRHDEINMGDVDWTEKLEGQLAEMIFHKAYRETFEADSTPSNEPFFGDFGGYGG